MRILRIRIRFQIRIPNTVVNIIDLPAIGDSLAGVCGGVEKKAELWSLEAVKVRKVTNPGLGIVRQEAVQYRSSWG
jgi:hypothetical protein